jgi:hypothetical protein
MRKIVEFAGPDQLFQINFCWNLTSLKSNRSSFSWVGIVFFCQLCVLMESNLVLFTNDFKDSSPWIYLIYLGKLILLLKSYHLKLEFIKFNDSWDNFLDFNVFKVIILIFLNKVSYFSSKKPSLPILFKIEALGCFFFYIYIESTFHF